MPNKIHKTYLQFEFSTKPERLIFHEKPTGQDLVNAMAKAANSPNVANINWERMKK